MSKEFDQSTFELGLQGFSNALYFTPNYLSDMSQSDLEPSTFLSHALTYSPSNRQPYFKNINNRILTPVRIDNTISSFCNINDV